MPLAEHSGLMMPMGAWVLRQACLQVAAWMDAHPGRQPPRVSINVAPAQLAAPGFMADVTGALQEAGVSGNRLAIEVTETGLMESTLGTSALEDLRAVGIQVFLDDFGTGYSSLSHLKRFPLDGVKIDRSFVEELESSQGARAIVQAIAGMGNALGLAVIAEGIETEGRLAALTSLGCDLGQGQLFSPAVSAGGPRDELGLRPGDLPAQT